jgi:antitoxin VapB
MCHGTLMTLHIKNEEADALARELADRLNTTVTAAVVIALRETLESARKQTSSVDARIAAIRAIQARVAATPIFDDRSVDEILGYDDNGLPT